MRTGLAGACLGLLLWLASSVAMSGSTSGIVSLDLCTDWMLLRYATPGQVQAYSPYLRQYPGPWSVERLPIHDGSLEQVLAHRPALVVSGEFNARLLRARLQQLGIVTRTLELPENLAEIHSYITEVRILLGQAIPDTAPDPPGFDPDLPRRGATLLLIGPNAIGTGRNTLEHRVIEAAGWDNYLQATGFRALELERVIMDAPDAVLLNSDRYPSLAARFASHPALAQLRSVQRIRLEESWRWECPGPWTFDLVTELAAWRER